MIPLAIQFKKESETSTFFDGEGTKIERTTEVRFDPLTGETSRLVFDPGLNIKPNDYQNLAEQTAGKNCPFCPENILKMTPVFSNEITKNGRMVHGEATLFPNLFPYSKYNGVAVFSDKHFVRLNEFTTPMIKDAFTVAQSFIHKVQSIDSSVPYTSINWNYLPISGGSIIHPHLHVIISERATNYQTITCNGAKTFKDNTNQLYFTALYKAEKMLKERWIGEYGNVAWMHAFAPKSHNDFIGFFKDTYTINDVTEQDWNDFAKGLQAIFKSLQEQGFSSFNFMLSADPNKWLPVHFRLIPRLTIGMLNTSDMNFFQALHEESLSYKMPEKITLETRKHF